VLKQLLEDATQLRGRTLTFSVRVRASVASAVRAGLRDSVNGYRYAPTYHSGGGSYETLTFTAVIPAASTYVEAVVQFVAVGTFYVDNATLVTGSIPADYTPPHPADDLMRCLRYCQVWGGSNLNEFVCVGQAWNTTRAQLYLPFQVPMGAAPTIAVSPGASSFAVYNAGGAQVALTGLTSPIVTPRGVYLDATVASGLVAGSATVLSTNNTLSARLVAEYNP